MTGISERIRRVHNDLAPAERRVVEALLDDYPMAGLGSVGDLAGVAGVSAPTVLRLVSKLGFAGYPEFREHVRGEVAARLFSPVEVYPRAAERASGLLATAERHYAEAVHATFRGLDPAEVERAVVALCDRSATVLVAGGRFSGVLATQGGPGDRSTHVENRVGEPAANPYLYLASQLVVGMDGLARELDPGSPEVEPYAAEHRPLLPPTLMDAVKVLDASALYRGAFGDGFVDWLLGIKRFEIERFTAAEGAWDPENVSQWEHREYFAQY